MTPLQDPQLKRLLLVLAAGTIGLVLIIVVTGVLVVLLVSQAPRHADPLAVDRPVPLPLPVPARPVVSSATTRTPSKPELPSKPEAPAPRERALEALGGLTVAHLYQSYLNIGLLADATENDVYPEADAKKLLASVTEQMATVDQQLANLAEAKLEAEDQQHLARVRQLTALLRTQAQELDAYWGTSENDTDARKSHETKYHKAREDAWAGIKDLLDIKP